MDLRAPLNKRSTRNANLSESIVNGCAKGRSGLNSPKSHAVRTRVEARDLRKLGCEHDVRRSLYHVTRRVWVRTRYQIYHGKIDIKSCLDWNDLASWQRARWTVVGNARVGRIDP